MTEAAPPLFLLAPKALLRAPPRPKVPPEYELRPYRFGDEMAYATLLNEIDPKLALAPYVEWTLAHALPEGLFFLVHVPTQHPAATAVALHDPKPGPAEFPFGGEVGNLVTATGHRGHGLGAAALGAALGRLISAGYTSIRVRATEHRLSALRLFLSVGFLPCPYSEDSSQRWRTVCANLGVPYTPSRWPHPG